MNCYKVELLPHLVVSIGLVLVAARSVVIVVLWALRRVPVRRVLLQQASTATAVLSTN